MCHKFKAVLILILCGFILSVNQTASAQWYLGGKLAKVLNRTLDIDTPKLNKLGLPKNIPLDDVRFVKVDRDGNWSSQSPDADSTHWQVLGDVNAKDIVVVTEANLTSNGFKHLTKLKPARIFIQRSRGGSIELDLSSPKARLLSGKVTISLNDPNLIQAALREFDRPFLGTKTRLIAMTDSPKTVVNKDSAAYASKPIIEKLSVEQVVSSMPDFKYQTLVVAGRIDAGKLYTSKLDEVGVPISVLEKSAASNKVSLVIVDSDKPTKTLKPMLKDQTKAAKEQDALDYIPTDLTTGDYFKQLASAKDIDNLELDFSTTQPFQMALSMRAAIPKKNVVKAGVVKKENNAKTSTQKVVDLVHDAYISTELVKIFRSTHDKEGRLASDVDLDSYRGFSKKINYLIGFILGFLVRKSVVNVWLSLLRRLRILKPGAKFGRISGFLGTAFLYIIIFPLFGVLLFAFTIVVKIVGGFFVGLFGGNGQENAHKSSNAAQSNDKALSLDDDGRVNNIRQIEGENGNYYRMSSDEGLNKTLIASDSIKEKTNFGKKPLSKSALDQLKKAAKQRTDNSILDLAYLFATGCGVPQDAIEAKQLYNSLKSDTSNIDFNIACLHRYGVSPLEQSWQDACELYQRSASEGNPAAINEIGWMHRMGQGLEFNLEKAEIHFQKAVELNYPMAFFNLGNFYLEGMVVNQDNARAIELYLKGAELGNLPSMANAAQILSTGREGVPLDRKQSHYWGRKAAREDYVAGMETLGSILMHDEDSGLQQEAISWLKKAADAGDAFAHFQLGCYYLNSDIVQQDYKQAWFHYEEGAKWPETCSITNLGSMCQHGQGVDKDLSRAAMYYKQASDLGNAQAMRNLALLYRKGQGVEQDIDLAFSLMKKAHDLGNRAATYNLADYYYAGLGCSEDDYQTASLYLNAAKRGHINSQRKLAEFYFHGIGVSEDYKLAAIWFQHAADAGDAKAMYYLAHCYADGLGTEQDYAKALTLFKSAYENGDADAACNIGTYYQKGLGTEANSETALYYYREGAKLNDASSKYNLGIMYLHGNGVEKSPAIALQWFLDAANQGEKNAMLMLADMYKKGNGVDKDLTEYKKWKNKFSE